jgi:hypothetical protein
MEFMASKWEADMADDKKNSFGHEFPLIMEPKDLYSNGKNRIFSEPQIQELFVSTCFYGRLGFVQPPCCLLCTYRETTDEVNPDKDCQKYVVWRKNAETPLHPNQLDGNIIVIPCHVVRKLLKGETVEGHAWDKNNKRVVLSVTE